MKTRLIAAVVATLLAGGSVAGIVVAIRGDGSSDGSVGDRHVRLTQTEMRYALMQRFGPLHYCDPDSFPVGVEGGEERGARAWWATVDRNGEEVTAIRRHLGLVGGDLTDPSVIRLYRDHKQLQAIPLAPAAGGFGFDVGTEVAAKHEVIATQGRIAPNGRVAITKQTRQSSFGCPICLAGRTLIDTPAGPVRVADLREGMPVWTLDAVGHRVAGTVVRTIRRAVATPHPMIRIVLSDERSVAASPAHPTRDGRLFTSLVVGDLVDGARIVSITVKGSTEPYTYDLLPSGPTGAYWADGVLIGSTLAIDLAA
jgi:hypothetical protein